MKNIIFLIICLMGFQQGFAQDKKVEINLEKNETIENKIHLGKYGFVLKFVAKSNRYKMKKEARLMYYDASCNPLGKKH